MREPRRKFSAERLAAQRERLGAGAGWFPLPALIAFVLVGIFTHQLVFATSPRLGHPAVVIEYPGEPSRPTAIWMSVDLAEDESLPVDKDNPCQRKVGDVIVSTSDRHVFQWPREVKDLGSLAPLTGYLKERIAAETLSAALAKSGDATQTRVILATDECLRYSHVRPILYSLAAAGITDYAFETRQPMLAHKADYLRDETAPESADQEM